jgi:acetyl esterase/lipase
LIVKTRRLLTIIMAIVFVLTLLPTIVMAADPDPLVLPSTPTATLHVTVDGVPLTVYNYRVVYVANPVPVMTGTPPAPTLDYETMNIYVPENATEDSPIILQDNNSGWLGGRAGTSVTDGASYNGTTNKVGVALKAGYVIANVGCRSRGMRDIDGNYVGHAPIQVVDIKAAIRYLRHNDAAMPGTTDRIIITGTSGGGGLGVAVAAAGNSLDYYPYLVAIGAAGVTYDAASNTYSSTLNDDVFGTVLYCPITDLNHADAAYEWMFNTTRAELTAEFGTYSADQMAASDWLKEDYVPYFNRLGLRDENGKRLTAPHLDEAITAIVEKEIEEAYVEVGPTQMYNDIEAITIGNPPEAGYRDHSWYSIDENGKATLDLDKYLYFIVRNQALKTPPAFDNYKSVLQGSMNESNLAGTPAQEYSPFSEWAWNHNGVPGDGVGSDDTGLLWRDYIHTDAGEAVVKQMDMIDPMPYLVSDANGDSAPYWYYRHGMRDRDTSFAVEVAMYYAVLHASGVHNVNFEIPWLKTHGGDYDVPEAYEWVAEAVANANTFDVVDALIDDTVTEGFSLPIGEGITYSSSNEDVFKVVDGQAVVTRPDKKDATVTLTVRVVSDQVAGTGYNYGKVDVTHAFTFTVPAKDK